MSQAKYGRFMSAKESEIEMRSIISWVFSLMLDFQGMLTRPGEGESGSVRHFEVVMALLFRVFTLSRS